MTKAKGNPIIDKTKKKHLYIDDDTQKLLKMVKKRLGARSVDQVIKTLLALYIDDLQNPGKTMVKKMADRKNVNNPPERKKE